MCFVSLFFVVSTSAVDCLERLVSEMTYYVSLHIHSVKSQGILWGLENVNFGVVKSFTFYGIHFHLAFNV